MPDRVDVFAFGMLLLTSPALGAGAGAGSATALTKAAQRKTEATEKRILKCLRW